MKDPLYFIYSLYSKEATVFSRLYSSAVFHNDFEEFSEAEICRRPVDDLLLQMKVSWYEEQSSAKAGVLQNIIDLNFQNTICNLKPTKLKPTPGKPRDAI